MTAALLKGSFMNFFRNPWAIIILVLLVVLLFGAGKLPGLARNVGKSMRIFKSEVAWLRGAACEYVEVGEVRGRIIQVCSGSREVVRRDDRLGIFSGRCVDPLDDEGEAERVHGLEDDYSYRRD